MMLKNKIIKHIAATGLCLCSYVFLMAQSQAVYKADAGSFFYHNGTFIGHCPQVNHDLNIFKFDTALTIISRKIWTDTSQYEGFGQAYEVRENGQYYYLWMGYSMGFAPPGAGFVSYVIKTDANGDTLWTHIYDTGGSMGCGFCLAADSNYVFSFVDGIGTIVKAERNTGDTLWTKHNIRQIGIYDHLVVNYTPIVSYNNSFYIGGASYPNPIAGVATPAMMLMKTDTTGSAQWVKTYGDSVVNVCYAMKQCHDSGFILVGTSAPFQNVETHWYHDYLVLRTDVNGDTLWCMRYDHDSLVDKPYQVLETPDHGFVIAGYSEDQNTTYHHSKSLLLRIDSVGNVMWAKTYDPYPNLYGTQASSNLRFTDRGGYMWGGGVLIVTDSMGNNCLAQPATMVASHPQMSLNTIPTTVTQGMLYCYRVPTQSYTPTGTLSWICNPQGTEEVKEEKIELSVFPNPAKDEIIISSNQTGNNVQITVTDITGREILSQKKLTANCKLNTLSLNPGIYFIKVTSDKGSVVKKFIKE
jgi:hypothetical protein